MIYLNLFQIYYDQSSRYDLHPNCGGLDNTKSQTVFFENTAILKMFDGCFDFGISDYVGIMSHKFFKKMPHFITPDTIKEEINNSKLDVYGFYPQRSVNTSIIVKSENWHPGFLKAFEYVADKIGLPIHYKGNRAHVYGNHFIARYEVYKEYVDKVLAPAIAIMSDESDTYLQKLLWVNTGYNKRDRKALDNMQAKFGIRYYPLHTFICERLFTMWLDTNSYSFKTLLK